MVFFVLICSKETKTEMNSQKVAHDSPHCTLIFCTNNYNSPFYFFIPKQVFFPRSIPGFKRRGWPNRGKNQNPKHWPLKKILYTTAHQQDYSVKIKPIKKILAKFFLPQKNPGIENLKPKKSFYHRRYLKSGVPLLGFRSNPNLLIERFAYDVLHNSRTDCRIRSWIEETYK